MSTITPEKNTAQLFLPGQTAAPEGPVDLTMMYVMHHAFRRDLDLFVSAVGATPVADGATWKALAARWELFGTVLHHHHTIEDDLIWPFLMEHADDAERATLEAMEAEHDEIDPLLAAVGEGFAAMASGGSAERIADVRNALKVRIAAARESLGRHLRHEETEALFVLQRWMSAEEWEAIDAIIEKKGKPAPLPFLVGWCAEGLSTADRDQVFGLVGTPFKVLWWLTRRSFRKGEAKAFRYVG